MDADTSDDVDDDAKLLLSPSRAMFSTAFWTLATSELEGAFRRGLMLRSPSSMNLTAWGSSMRRSESSTSSMSMRRCWKALPYSEKGSSLKFLRLAGLKETRERTCVIFLSRRDCERRRAHMLDHWMRSAMKFHTDDDGDDNDELYMYMID